MAGNPKGGCSTLSAGRLRSLRTRIDVMRLVDIVLDGEQRIDAVVGRPIGAFLRHASRRTCDVRASFGPRGLFAKAKPGRNADWPLANLDIEIVDQLSRDEALRWSYLSCVDGS